MKQIELELGGEKRTFHFGLGFLGNLLESEKIAMSEIDAKLIENPFKWIPLIMYYSCAYGYVRNNETVPFNNYNFADWVSELGMDSETVTSFFQAFTKSLTKDVPQDEDDKKKATKK